VKTGLPLILALGFTTAMAAETPCPALTLQTDPTIKGYRLDRSVCRRIHDASVTVDTGGEKMVLYVISGCRDIGGPTFCDVALADLAAADADGDCQVEVDWRVTAEGAASCILSDR